MADKKKNQPPTSEGKKQSPVKGESRKLAKRSMVSQASGPRQNIQTDDEEQAYRENPSEQKNKPKRAKAGR
jgi:hypothetical protein